MKQYFEAYFDVLAEQGDPDYKTFYDRVLTKPEEAVYKSMEEGMARLKDERVVLHITDMILFHHLEETSKVVPGMHIFSEGRPEIKGPIIF